MEKEQFIISDKNNSLSVKGTGKVTINKSIYIAGSNCELPINIVADFSKIPEKYHKLYYDALVSEYYHKTDDIFYINNKKNTKIEEKTNINKILDIMLKTFKFK